MTRDLFILSSTAYKVGISDFTSNYESEFKIEMREIESASCVVFHFQPGYLLGLFLGSGWHLP